MGYNYEYKIRKGESVERAVKKFSRKFVLENDMLFGNFVKNSHLPIDVGGQVCPLLDHQTK